MKIAGIIILAAYLAALPYVIIMIRGFKKGMELETLSFWGFMSMWLIMPVFLIKRIFNS